VLLYSYTGMIQRSKVLAMKTKTNKCKCGNSIHKGSLRCYSCNVQSRKPKFSGDIRVVGIVVLEGKIIDLAEFEVYDLSTKIKFSRKHKFDMECIVCKARFSTHTGREIKKKNKWMCQSCAISSEWADNDYRVSHVNALIDAKSSDESKQKHSLAQKKKWQNPKIRKKMKDSLRKVWDTKEYRQNLSDKLKSRWLENPPKCYSRKYTIQTSKGNIVVRSSYERDFIRYLDANCIEWEYEPKTFMLKSYENRSLIPDFYLPTLDLWVEVKGYFWKDTKEKWESFCQEYPDIKKTLIFKKDLTQLLTEEKKIEDYL